MFEHEWLKGTVLDWDKSITLPFYFDLVLELIEEFIERILTKYRTEVLWLLERLLRFPLLCW